MLLQAVLDGPMQQDISLHPGTIPDLWTPPTFCPSLTFSFLGSSNEHYPLTAGHFHTQSTMQLSMQVCQYYT